MTWFYVVSYFSFLSSLICIFSALSSYILPFLLFNIFFYRSIKCFMNVFKSLGMRCVPYLDDVLPYLLEMASSCSKGLRESIIQQLTLLVTTGLLHFFSLVIQFILYMFYFFLNSLISSLILSLPFSAREQCVTIFLHTFGKSLTSFVTSGTIIWSISSLSFKR